MYSKTLSMYSKTLNIYSKTLNTYLKTLNTYSITLNSYFKTLNIYLKTINIYLKTINIYSTKTINIYSKPRDKTTVKQGSSHMPCLLNLIGQTNNVQLFSPKCGIQVSSNTSFITAQFDKLAKYECLHLQASNNAVHIRNKVGVFG